MRNSKNLFSSLRGLFYKAAFAKCRAVADDQATPTAMLHTGPNIGDYGRDDSASNLLAVADLSLTSGTQKVHVYYGESSPVGSYSNAPYGSMFYRVQQSSGATTDVDIYIKMSTGWEKLSVTNEAAGGSFTTVSSVSTAGAATQTIAQYLGGYIRRDPAGASRSDVTATAALIVAGIEGADVGSSVEFAIENVSDAEAEVVTVTAGVGVTLSPTVIYLKPGSSKRLLAVCTNVTASSEAVTMYDMDKLEDALSVYGTADVTAGANTWTAAEVLGGLLLRDPTGADRSDVLPTAALLVAAIPDARVGSEIEFTVVNTADADENVTITGGSGMTLVPTSITVGRGGSKKLIARCTNVTASSEAVTIYDAAGVGFSDVTARVLTFKKGNTAGASGAITITAAQLLLGYLQNDCGGGAINATTATAAQIVAAIPNCQVGSAFTFSYENISNGAETATLVGGTNVTIAANQLATVARTYMKSWLFIVTNATASSEAVSVYMTGEAVANAI